MSQFPQAQQQPGGMSEDEFLRLTFILDADKNVINPKTMLDFNLWIMARAEDAKIITVGCTDIGRFHISTVFLQSPMNLAAIQEGEPPVIFETLIMDNDVGGEDHELIGYCDRYTTWRLALEGHIRTIELVMTEFMEERTFLRAICSDATEDGSMFRLGEAEARKQFLAKSHYFINEYKGGTIINKLGYYTSLDEAIAYKDELYKTRENSNLEYVIVRCQLLTPGKEKEE